MCRNWRLSVATAVVAQFLCVTAWQACPAFFPYFVRELGVIEPAQIALWSGLLVSADGAAMALMSPIWGMLADRYGPKVMAQRAALCACPFLLAQAFVGSVPHLLVLRLLLGAAAGTVPAYMTLAASITPASELGFALGMMQMAVYTGLSLGPLAGGIIADHSSYRSIFVLSAAGFLAAFFLTSLIADAKASPARDRPAAPSLVATARTMLRSAAVRGAAFTLVAVFMANAAYRPLLPLLVETLQRDSHLLNTSTGLAFGAGAVASALSAVFVGRVSDRVCQKDIMVVCGLGAAMAYVGHAVAPSYGLVIVATVAAGLFAGGLAPAANATLARAVPAEQRGTAYGLSNFLTMVGKATGPLFGPSIAVVSGLRCGFLGPGALFALIALTALRRIQPPHADVQTGGLRLGGSEPDDESGD